ncbi:MAG: aldehyde dehydrogenase family protein [Thermoplasmata archaeon]|nr:MAG: aldehyde dehydrogenase family protein [Thermoplasmata archaeon]
MLEIEALVEDWESTGRTRLLMDADQVARDPRLALAGRGLGARPGRRLFSRGGTIAATPEGRFAEAYRATRGTAEVSPSRMEEAAFARVHQADLLMVGRALEAGAAQHDRLKDIRSSTRAELLAEVLRSLETDVDEIFSAGTAEGHTRKGLEWEMERIRAILAPDVLEDISSTILKRKWEDGTRMFMEGLGTVGVMVPCLGGLSRAVLSLAASFMTGNFTVMAAPCESPAATMVALRLVNQVLSGRDVRAISAFVPDDMPHIRGILADSPRVDGMVMFEGGEEAMEAAARASSLTKAVVGAWETTDVAIVWDDADLDSAAETIVASRFTDSGRLPSCIGRVLVHKDSKDQVVTALEREIHKLRVGLASDPATDVGPLTSLEELERLPQVVEEARELGATIVHGGSRINWRGELDPLGMHFQPTLLEDCDAGMRILNEPLAGPVLPVCTATDEKEARGLSCRPRRPGRVWIWANARADRDRLVERLRAPGIIFFGRRPGGTVKALELADAWGALEMAERLSYKSWRGPFTRERS